MPMPGPLVIFWDHGQGGNVEHLAQHEVSPEEAEQVLGRYFEDREPSHSTPEYWVVSGFTDKGRFLLVVFEYLTDRDVVIPVTAFEPRDS